MPTPSESKHEQIAAALRTLLAGITAGATYWFTPSKVLRVDGFWTPYFDPSAVPTVAGTRTLILLRPGDERKVEDTDEEIAREMDVYVCIAQVYEPQGTDDPFLVAAPIPWTIQSRLVQDVETAIYQASIQAGYPLGLSFVENVETPDTNRQFYVGELWIAAEITILVKYTTVGVAQ